MARIEDNDLNDFILGSLIVVIGIAVLIGLITVAYNTFTTFENKKTKLAELKSKSDSYVLLTSGKYTNTYYTTRSTIQVTEHGSCIAFIDNSTSTPVSACTQFIIKAN